MLKTVAALGTALVISLAAAGAAGAYPTLSGTIWTIAGNGSFCAALTGTCGDGPVATAAQVSRPTGVAVDGDGNVYIADSGNNKLRKLTKAGAISTIAGDGTFCLVATSSCGDGPNATAAQLGTPSGLAVDTAGNVYIAEEQSNKVRKLTPAGAISTIAGNGSACALATGSCGDGPDATAAQLRFPNGVAVDAAGNVYIADAGNNKVRKLTPAGAISTIAGDGSACALATGSCGDGPDATAAQLRFPTGVAVDTAGNVYIADALSNKVRKLTPAGAISTIAGDGNLCAARTGSCGDGADATAAQLRFPRGVAVDAAGNVYIADQFDDKVRKLTPAGAISTIAGTGSACVTSPFCGDGVVGYAAMLNAPSGVAVDAAGRNVFIADQDDNLIRWLTGADNGSVGAPGAPRCSRCSRCSRPARRPGSARADRRDRARRCNRPARRDRSPGAGRSGDLSQQRCGQARLRPDVPARHMEGGRHRHRGTRDAVAERPRLRARARAAAHAGPAAAGQARAGAAAAARPLPPHAQAPRRPVRRRAAPDGSDPLRPSGRAGCEARPPTAAGHRAAPIRKARPSPTRPCGRASPPGTPRGPWASRRRRASGAPGPARGRPPRRSA